MKKDKRNVSGAVLEAGHQTVLAGLGLASLASEKSADAIDAARKTGGRLADLPRDATNAVKERVERTRTGFADTTANLIERGEAVESKGREQLLDAIDRFRSYEKGMEKKAEEMYDKVSDTSRRLLSLEDSVVLHVVHGDDGWEIKAEGEDKPLSTWGTKKEALDEARTVAKSRTEGRLVVHGKDGRIQEQFSYHKGA